MKFQLLNGIFLLLLYHGLSAQVLEDYQDSWRPVRGVSWLMDNNQIELKLDLKSFPVSELEIKLPAESTVFIDGKLWYLTEADTVIYRVVQELRAEFAKDSVSFVVVSRHHAYGNPSIKKVAGHEHFDEGLVAEVSNDWVEERFVTQSIKDFYITGLLVILFFLALYKIAYPYLLYVMVQPLAVINAEDFSDGGNLQKFFSFDILSYLLIVGMMISEIIVLSLLIYKKEWLERWIGIDYLTLLMVWFFGALGILVFTVVKFLGIRVISYLFDLGKTEFSHFFYLLRLIVFGSSLMLLVGAFFIINDYSGLESAVDYMIPLLFWGYALGMVGLFLIMMNRLSFKKYHLFTYLCIAELIPFLILSKWIMYLGQ